MSPHEIADILNLITHIASMEPVTETESMLEFLKAWAARLKPDLTSTVTATYNAPPQLPMVKAIEASVKRMRLSDEVENVLKDVEENISLVREGLGEWRDREDDVRPPYYARDVEQSERSLRDAVGVLEKGASEFSKKVKGLVSRAREEIVMPKPATVIIKEVAHEEATDTVQREDVWDDTEVRHGCSDWANPNVDHRCSERDGWGHDGRDGAMPPLSPTIKNESTDRQVKDNVTWEDVGRRCSICRNMDCVLPHDHDADDWGPNDNESEQDGWDSADPGRRCRICGHQRHSPNGYCIGEGAMESDDDWGRPVIEDDRAWPAPDNDQCAQASIVDTDGWTNTAVKIEHVPNDSWCGCKDCRPSFYDRDGNYCEPSSEGQGW
jgi:hypothetical protein